MLREILAAFPGFSSNETFNMGLRFPGQCLYVEILWATGYSVSAWLRDFAERLVSKSFTSRVNDETFTGDSGM